MRLLLLALAFLVPATSQAQINVERVFLGFTSATFTGGSGQFGYQTACAAEFENSRMCTSEEILRSPTTPTGLVGTAWVSPVYVAPDLDASGLAGPPSDLSCSQWGNASPALTGLAVNSSGPFVLRDCSVARSIACCGPPVSVKGGDLNGDGKVSILDEVILRRMLAGLPVYLR